MYNVPYYGYRGEFNQQPQQQPIQNIINTQMPFKELFMAQYLNENEKVEDIFVNNKTAFIDLKNKELKIKEINGNITTYGLILPKDEKDEKIEELQRQILELKGVIVDGTTDGYIPTNFEIPKQDSNGSKFNKSKSSTK